MWSIGADPEVFLTDVEGKVISACGQIGGTKARPKPIPGLKTGFAVQEDNVMLEFNVPPTDSPEAFASVITDALSVIRTKILAPKGYNFDRRSSIKFAKSKLVVPQAQEFGCSPDFDAYKDGEAWKQMSPKDLVTPKGDWRFAGGHIHIGYDLSLPPFVVANFCDVYLGLTSVIHGEQQGERRKWYGQPGRFRPTSYGLEYRTPSNWWIFSMDQCYHLAAQVQKMVSFLQKSDTVRLKRAFAEIPWADVRQAIQNEHKTLSRNVDQYIRSEVLADD